MTYLHNNIIPHKTSFFIVSLILWGSTALFGITVPYKNFFLDPFPTMAKEEMISPNGNYVASLHSESGGRVLKIQELIANNDGSFSLDTTHPVTHTEPRIAGLTWTRDSHYILFFEDQGGDENFHLYRFDPSHPDREATDLTPQPRTQARIVSLPKNAPEEVVIETNTLDEHVFDVYRLNIKNRKCELLEKNPGNVTDWVADTHGVIRARYVEVGTTVEIQVRNTAKDPFRVLTTCAFDDTPTIYGFSPDGASLYFSRAKENDTTSLVQLDLPTGKETLLTEDPNYDLNELLLSDKNHQPLAAGILQEHFVYKPLNKAFEKDLQFLKKLHEGDLHFQSSSENEKRWIVFYDSPENPATYLYERENKRVSLLHSTFNDSIASMEPIAFTSRDGLLLHGYLTLPKNKEPKNLPLIVFVHGGPWARDQWGFNPSIQRFTQRGFAVLQVNYRGSMGYGKQFLEAGDKESGRKMIADVIDGTRWAVAQGIADPKRLGIYGASYGGYLTLCGLAFYPDLFACGIDYVGVSDLVTLLNNTYVPYWKPIQDVLFQRIGNPFTEKQLLIDQSPLTQVDKIKAPLFIAYGANDIRVNRIQSEEMIAALQEKGKLSEPPLLKDNEGHGFKNFNNSFEFTERADSFFEKYLLTQGENKSIQEGESKSN